MNPPVRLLVRLQRGYEIIWDAEDKPEQMVDAPLERKLDGWLMDANWVVGP